MTRKPIYILVLIAGVLVFGCGQRKNNKERSMGTEKIDIKEELEWSEIEDFINSISRKKFTLDQGKDTIISFLKKRYPSFDTEPISKIDLNNLKREFIEWVSVPLQKSPPDKNIKSLYFGLFESSDPELSDNEKSVMVFYVAGSDRTPVEDPTDWAVEPRYFPDERYVVFDDYILLYNEVARYNNNANVEQILMNGISNLILSNSLHELKELTRNKGLYVGSGFDEGPAFIVSQ